MPLRMPIGILGRTHPPAITPTQVVQLDHGNGRKTEKIVWPRPESADPALAQEMALRRRLAAPDTPSAHGHRWAPDSKGAKMNPMPPTRNVARPSPRLHRQAPNSPAAGLICSREGNAGGVGGVGTVYVVGQGRSGSGSQANRVSCDESIAPTATWMPAQARCSLNDALKAARRARDASQSAEMDARELMRHVSGLPHSVYAVLERLTSGSAVLRGCCQEAAQATVRACAAQHAESQRMVEARKERAWQLEAELQAVSTIWRRELEELERTGQRERWKASTEHERELIRAAAAADREASALVAESSDRALAIASLREEVIQLELQLSRATAEGHLATQAAQAHAHEKASAAQAAIAQKSAQTAMQVNESYLQMMEVRRELAAVQDECARLRQVVRTQEAADALKIKRIDELQTLRVQEMSHLHRKIEQQQAHATTGSAAAASTLGKNAQAAEASREASRVEHVHGDADADVLDESQRQRAGGTTTERESLPSAWGRPPPPSRSASRRRPGSASGRQPFTFGDEGTPPSASTRAAAPRPSSAR